MCFSKRKQHTSLKRRCFLAESEDKIVSEAGEVDEKEKSEVSDLKDIFAPR